MSYFSISNAIQIYPSGNIFENESHFPAKSINCSCKKKCYPNLVTSLSKALLIYSLRFQPNFTRT